MTLEQLPTQTGLATWVQTLGPARQLAEIVASTDFVPGALRGNPDACCACIMYGAEIGITPMQALASIHVVDGRPQPSAELVRAMILAAGHQLRIHAATAQSCKLSGLRRGEDESQRDYVEYSLDDARRAGLANRQAWTRYPRAMCVAAATRELGRRKFPDVMKGLHLGDPTDDDIATLDTWAAEASDPAPAPVAPTRTVARKARKAISQAQTVPLPEEVPDAAPEAPRDPTEQDWKRARNVAGADPWLKPEDTPEPPPGAPTPVAAPSGQVPQVAPGEPAPRMVTDREVARLMAACSRAGVDTRDRTMRLALFSKLLGHPVTSSKELTYSDHLTLLRYLNDIETRALEWDYSTTDQAVSLRWVEGK